MAAQYEKHYLLENDARSIRGVLDELRRDLEDYGDGMHVCMALSEALTNAMHHGNLEVDSELREDGSYFDAIEARHCERPYCDRRVHLVADFRGDRAVFVVRHAGRGLGPQGVPDPRLAENLERKSGRGLLLMRAFAHEVRFNEIGNELTLVFVRKGNQQLAAES